jgi:hypothetical protein
MTGISAELDGASGVDRLANALVQVVVGSWR